MTAEEAVQALVVPLIFTSGLEGSPKLSLATLPSVSSPVLRIKSGWYSDNLS